MLVVFGELGEAGPAVDQDIVGDLVGRGVDEMRHIGGFGGVDQHLAVGADAHAFRLYPDRDLGEHRTLLDVDHGHQVVVLVGDEERVPAGMKDEKLRVGSARQSTDDLKGF